MDALLDTDRVQLILSNHERLKEKRAFYEPTWRDIDRFVDPFGAGAWDKGRSTFTNEVDELFDVTALDGLDRYTAAIAGVTIPRQQRWHGVAFDDAELMKIPAVARWCEIATDRLFLARYAPWTGFEAQAHEDIRQEGKYGTSAMWIGDNVGRGLFYKTLHLSEIYIDEDFSGRVDTVHRCYVEPIKSAVAEFERYGGISLFSDRTQRDFADPKKRNNEIEILHIVRPNKDYEPGYFGPKGKPIESIYIELNEKHVIRRSGFNSMPIPVSRHITGPRDAYGRSPAMKALATIKGLNAMARTILDAANKAVDPPLLYDDDADITKIVTKAGGLTAGGVVDGKIAVHALMTGAQLPVGLEIQTSERAVVKSAFLDEFFRLLTDPSDRMTATQVMETLQKEGVLIAPFAGRRETEKLAPQVERELDILTRAKGALPPLPPEVQEAGVRPRAYMTNPLSRMARAEEVTGFSRWVEIGIQAAGAGRQDALDRVNFDSGMVVAADVLGVRPSLVYSDDELTARRQSQQQDQAAGAIADAAPGLSQAELNMAKAREISSKLGEGGGL